MRHLLAGYYGMRNLGDDVLLYATLGEVARVDREATFTVISERPEVTPPRTRVTITPGNRRLENARQMLRHDVLLFGGGGLLQDASPRSQDYLVRLAHVARIVKLMRRKVVMLGIGVGPLTTDRGRAAARSLLRLSDFVTVRDEESRALAAELARDAPVEVTGDLAFLLPAYAEKIEPCEPPKDGRKTLGVSLLPYAGSLGQDRGEDARAVAAVAEVLDDILARNPDWRVTLFEFFSGSKDYGDRTVLRPLQERLAFPDRVSYRPYAGDFLSVFSEMRTCQAFLGMRFHSCLLSHLAGVPCLMVAYHPKCENLAARLQMSADAVVPLPVLHDAAMLRPRVEALLSDGAKFRPRIAVDALAAQSARTFTLFASWLERQGVRGHA